MSNTRKSVELHPVPDVAKPNLTAAGWRIVHSAQRFQELKETMHRLASEWVGYPAVRAPRSNPSEIEFELVEWSWYHLPTARQLTMLASEVLHHARISLDYCAYHAVWKDSGKIPRNTKFPLVVSSDKWGKERRNSISGMNAEHTDWIKMVQPFNNVSWSSRLVRLSNRDKHEVAVHVLPTYRFQLDTGRTFADPLGRPDYLGYFVENPYLDLYMSPLKPREDPSDERYPLEETLLEIVLGVSDLVNRFLVEDGFSPIVIIREVDHESSLGSTELP